MDVLILLDGYFNLTPDARIQIKLLMFLDRFHGFLFSVNLTFSEIQSWGWSDESFDSFILLDWKDWKWKRIRTKNHSLDLLTTFLLKTRHMQKTIFFKNFWQIRLNEAWKRKSLRKFNQLFSVVCLNQEWQYNGILNAPAGPPKTLYCYNTTDMVSETPPWGTWLRTLQ